MNNRRISIHDFQFRPHGYGHYKVTYTSPKTGISWSNITNNMVLIDLTKNDDKPLIKNLNRLKWMCKQGTKYRNK